MLSLGLILSLSFVLLVSLTLSTMISSLRTWVTDLYSPLLGMIGVVDLLISIGLMTSLFALIYRYVPERRLAWRLVAIGGFLTALLLWLYYTAQIFLLGAEFTACLGGLRNDGSNTTQRRTGR